MDLKRALSFPPYPGEYLHPVVYACTAVLLLCLLVSIITYIVHHSTIRISRKGWHVLINLCFYTAVTFTVFAAGINRIKYPLVCQAVGIALHYSSLSTLLWLGVTARSLYQLVTKVTKRPPQAQDGDPPRHPKSTPTIIRFYVVSGGLPLIACGVTAGIDMDHYGSREEAPYCWMSWEPSLGAFYGPAAFIVVVTCVYFLCIYVHLKRHPELRYELRPMTEEQQRLATAEMGHCHAGDSGEPGDTAHAGCSAINPSMLANEHSYKAQLRTAAFSLLLFLATWTFGALAVWQGHFLDMIFSCLYGAFSVTLGLFLLIQHCAKRDDVWHRWWSCCPARRHADAPPKVDVNGDVHTHSELHCQEAPPCPSKALLTPHLHHTPSTHCKLSNLQVPPSHSPCCAAVRSQQLLEDESRPLSSPTLPLQSCLKDRTKPHSYSRPRPGRLREYAYHMASSSMDSSVHSFHLDSPHSAHEGHTCLGAHEGHTCHSAHEGHTCLSMFQGHTCHSELEGHLCHLHACCAKPATVAGTCHAAGSERTAVFSCSKTADEDAHSLLQETSNQSRTLTSSSQDDFLYSSDSTGNIRTGPWKNETTV
ncbi:adhesion G protein-coupled receptor A1 [Megalops cyprinoides]|uniref:adhesion G protein-coupled receptor A1 n=1 Tax=Megalops cyprinoides TaxID=118141 RepID=UPI0018647323|nr:adhesion G protein-coupled receptor A1 [Megalops cyprinoides]XP_036398946.1 adhesion G protein-coupled receptor A1 [Megalops cyprinoides]